MNNDKKKYISSFLTIMLIFSEWLLELLLKMCKKKFSSIKSTTKKHSVQRDLLFISVVFTGIMTITLSIHIPHHWCNRDQTDIRTAPFIFQVIIYPIKVSVIIYFINTHLTSYHLVQALS